MVTFEKAILEAYRLPAKALTLLPGLSQDQKQAVTDFASSTITHIETEYLQGLTPFQVIFGTLVSLIAIKVALNIVDTIMGLTWDKLKEKIFRLALYIPMVAAHVD